MRDVRIVAASIEARLDRLPATMVMWSWVGVLSFGAFFETYDVALTAFLSPALVKAGIFKASDGLFGLSDQANFIAATFLGLWIGTLLFSAVADRVGRKPVFVASLVWYALATLVMGLQSTAMGVDLWRIVAGVGIGVQIVSIDCYLAELLPKADRGRGFALSAFWQFLAIPVGAGLSIALVSNSVAGVAGWRCLAFIPALAALALCFIGRGLPESPRWLATHGRRQQAEQLLETIESRVRHGTGQPLPPLTEVAPSVDPVGTAWDFLRPPYRRTVVMLVVFHLFQTVGFFGFANWAPSLIVAQGVPLKSSLIYTAAIAIAYPLSPLVFSLVADRIERKWLIVIGALGAAAAGLVFSGASTATGWIVSGFLLTISSSLMSFASHTYQSEVFPTRMRARAVSFVYSFSRLAAMLSGYVVASLLRQGGPTAVFAVLAACFVVVSVVIGGFGPRTTKLSLESITR